MAFDGITIAAIKKELSDLLINGHISKITQPESDELLLTIKNNSNQYRLVLSANASLPLVYLREENKVSPVTAPSFCMLLRKHIQNGRILSIEQPEFERILVFSIEHQNELGDTCQKKLIIELMGKYSNIIFTDMENKIIDSIKHIPASVSSIREVLPGCPYFIPQTQKKENPLFLSRETFFSILFLDSTPCFQTFYSHLTGFSPLISQELCAQSYVDSDLPSNSLTEEQKNALWDSFSSLCMHLKNESFSPTMVYDADHVPLVYAAVPLPSYQKEQTVSFDSISKLLVSYYAQKESIQRIRQRSVDLRKIVQTAYERTIKKYDLQMHQLKDTEKMGQYKLYGELLHTYGYSIQTGVRFAEVLNYYDNTTIRIPLDPMLTPLENAKRYFDRYGKQKRTRDALLSLTKEVWGEILHLESIINSLEIAEKEEDLFQIRQELIDYGYIHKKGDSKKQRFTSHPFCYLSHDGFSMYVGKNNYQNEELTFKFATGNDWWFHAKGIPGSHVIVKSDGKELPDQTFEEAAALAAHYSKGGQGGKIEVDYTQKKNVKKPGDAKPGFVVYHTNYSMLITTDISGIEKIGN